MSWKGSGNFRSAGPRTGGNGPQSLWEGGSAGGPPLLPLIIATCVIGVVALVLAIALSGLSRTASAPAAQPTVAAQPTAAPAAAQPTAAPAAGAAAIPTEAVGPALATGSGEAASLGSDGELLAFDQTSLSVPSGLVTLNFVNNSSAVQHNWVLVEGDATVAAAVNDAAQQQSSAARNAAAAVPLGDTPGLLAATPMVDPGASYSVTFETPGPGTYIYICTFPGHYLAGMVGELVVN